LKLIPIKTICITKQKFRCFQISLLVEKKESTQLNEKFGPLRVSPSVKGFGGRPLEGCLVVSATGMVGAIVLAKESPTDTLASTSESLAAMRNRITTADICYGKSKQSTIL